MTEPISFTHPLIPHPMPTGRGNGYGLISASTPPHLFFTTSSILLSRHSEKMFIGKLRWKRSVGFVWFGTHDHCLWHLYKGSKRDATTCTRNYKENECGVTRIPFIAEQCDEWFICMSSDPESIGKVKIAVGVTAEVLAELLEGFVGRLSYKTIVRPAIQFLWDHLFGDAYTTISGIPLLHNLSSQQVDLWSVLKRGEDMYLLY